LKLEESFQLEFFELEILKQNSDCTPGTNLLEVSNHDIEQKVIERAM